MDDPGGQGGKSELLAEVHLPQFTSPPTNALRSLVSLFLGGGGAGGSTLSKNLFVIS